MFQDERGWLRHPIWTVIGTLAAILSLLFAIFIWFVPNYKVLFPDHLPTTPTSKVTSSSTSIPATPNHHSTSTNSTTIYPSWTWLWWTILTGLIIGTLANFIVRPFNRGCMVHLVAILIGVLISGFLTSLVVPNDLVAASIGLNFIAFFNSYTIIFVIRFIRSSYIRLIESRKEGPFLPEACVKSG